jgi:hypothetical protein
MAKLRQRLPITAIHFNDLLRLHSPSLEPPIPQKHAYFKKEARKREKGEAHASHNTEDA